MVLHQLRDALGSPPAIRVAGLAVSLAYAAFIVWIYATQPQTMAEVSGGLASRVGAYRVDPTAFEEGLAFFRKDQFAEARMALERADAARRDPVTQFYIAYAFYRQGWGRFYNDDALFAEGLEAVTRAAALAPGGRVIVDDPDLGLRSSDELRAELERGLRRELSDLDPRRVLRERK
jgi:tetratricopeptide (TPR) repeat protein